MCAECTHDLAGNYLGCSKCEWGWLKGIKCVFCDDFDSVCTMCKYYTKTQDYAFCITCKDSYYALNNGVCVDC